MYCFTPISHGVENYFPGLWGTGTSDSYFIICFGGSGESIMHIDVHKDAHAIKT